MNIVNLCVVILVGGRGRRLRSVTGQDLPKSLALVRQTPFLWYLLDFVGHQGVRNVVLATGHLSERILHELPRIAPSNMQVHVSEEREPLGTGGAVLHALPHVTSDPFLLMNGDSIVIAPIDRFLAFHIEQRGIASIVLKQVDDIDRYGLVQIDRNRQIVRFTEKSQEVSSGLINTGVYLLNHRALATIPEMQPCSLERDVLPLWAGDGLYGFISDGPFIDIGTPESFREAQTFFANWPLSDKI